MALQQRRRSVPEAVRIALAVLVVGVTGAWGIGTAGAASPKVTVEYAMWRSGTTLQVTQVFVGAAGDRAALLPGARDVNVPGGEIALLLPGSMAIPSGATRAEVSYWIPFPATGLSLKVPVYTSSQLAFVLAGEGVAFPIVLNQAFFQGGKDQAMGHTFEVYGAKGFSKAFRLNIEPASANQGFDLEWLWVVPALGLAAYLLARVRRRHA